MSYDRTLQQRLYSSHVEQPDLLFGTGEKIRELVEELQRDHPDTSLLAVLTSCSVGLIGDDVSGIVKKDPPSDAVGKVVKTINWYLLCPVTSEQALTVAAGDSKVVDVSIPRVMSGSIPATIVGVNQSSKAEGGLLVLKSDYMNGTLADIRRENITIKTRTYSGLRISRSAIHDDYVTVQDYDEDGNKIGQPHQEKVQGVYVVHGKRLTFVQVKIIYSDNDFVICSDDPTDKEILNGTTLTLHDTVVVRGKELYDGKIVR